jgi:hypothetical protein
MTSARFFFMQTAEQLRILSIFHYVVGGIHAFFGCFGIFHFAIGVSMLVCPNFFDKAPPGFFPWIFVLVGGGWMLAGWIVGFLTILSGRFITRRAHRTFSLVVGGINCVFIGLGTALGVFDIILLTRDDVRREYEPAGL